MKRILKIGTVVHKLTVTEYLGTTKTWNEKRQIYNYKTMFKCVCTCGKTRDVHSQNLLNKSIRSCGSKECVSYNHTRNVYDVYMKENCNV